MYTTVTISQIKKMELKSNAFFSVAETFNITGHLVKRAYSCTVNSPNSPER